MRIVLVREQSIQHRAKTQSSAELMPRNAPVKPPRGSLAR